MGVIRVLSPGLVNRIAAGECVERPASVVKELVENALDAGASRIEVNILDGGRESIQVSDDGVGMAPDDLRLSVHPHATSKLAADDDLFNIHTMGFRGEALASIGSVARLTITSRTRGSDVGHRLSLDGDRLEGPVPCGAPPGTCVEVRDLFHAVPARRKFLKTTSTEMGHITEQFARLALAHAGVSFVLRHSKKAFHDLAATGDRRSRIRDLYGPEMADVLLAIAREGGGVRIEGLVAPPKDSRAAAKWEYVFVNGRFVRDRFVSHAIKEAYRSLIDPSRYPVAFLFITIDPASVDVNVHPTKTEVRWRDSNYIHGQVLAALRDKFLATNLDHRLRTPAAEDQYRERVRSAMVDFFTRKQVPESARPSEWSTRSEPATRERAEHAAQSTIHNPQSAINPQSTIPNPQWIAAPQIPAAPQMPAGPRTQPAAATEAPTTDWLSARPDDGRRAIQIHRTYLVVETPEGMMVIDQHALHERILYEELQRRVTQHPLESQRLLLPEVLRVPADRLETLESHADTLARLGLELTPAGPASVALQAFPSLLERADRAAFVRDLLDRLAQPGARPDSDTLLHELLDMMACKAAVKAGDPLTPEEISALLKRRELAERSSHCPHGRPTTLHLSLHDLERQFRRR